VLRKALSGAEERTLQKHHSLCSFQAFLLDGQGLGVRHSFLQKTLDDIPERYFPNPCTRRASLSSAATSQHGQITHSVRGRLLLVPLDAA